jgi:hypothetical protein
MGAGANLVCSCWWSTRAQVNRTELDLLLHRWGIAMNEGAVRRGQPRFVPAAMGLEGERRRTLAALASMMRASKM